MSIKHRRNKICVARNILVLRLRKLTLWQCSQVKREPSRERTSCPIPSHIIPHFSTPFYSVSLSLSSSVSAFPHPFSYLLSFSTLYSLHSFLRSSYVHTFLLVFLSRSLSHWTTSPNQSSSHWTPSKKASRLVRQFSTLKKAFSDPKKRRIAKCSIHTGFHTANMGILYLHKISMTWYLVGAATMILWQSCDLSQSPCLEIQIPKVLLFYTWWCISEDI